jgi:hypothetical protein
MQGGENLKGKIVFLALMVLLLSANGFAIVRTPQTSIDDLRITYTAACFRVQWSAATISGYNTADFNNYRLQVTSSNSSFNGIDENVTVVSRTYCTAAPGDSLSVIVQRYDGNAEGHFVNQGVEGGLFAEAGDLNGTLQTSGIAGAGIYLFYAVLIAVAGLAALIVITAIILSVMRKMPITDVFRGVFK